MIRKILVWALFSIAMLAWGFVYAVVLSIAVHHLSQGLFLATVVGALFLAFFTKEAYFWVDNPPWKAKGANGGPR